MLANGLRELLTALPETGAAAQSLALYRDLATLAPQLGSDWSSVLLIGNFPAADPEVSSYTEAWLSMRFRAAKLRISYWTPSEQASEILDAVIPSLGGIHVVGDVLSFASTEPAQLDEVLWREPALRAGFRVCPVTLTRSDGTNLTVPSALLAPGATLPEPERYALLRQKIKSLSTVLMQPDLSGEQTRQAESDLDVALQIGPRQVETLRLAAELHRRESSDSKLAATLSILTEIEPAEAKLFVELGDAQFRSKDWDGADRALLRARELAPGDPHVAEELARIRLARGDDRGALPFLEESLTSGGASQDLWLLRADVATRRNDWQRITDSLEHAIALGSVPLDRRTTLVKLYIAHQLPDRALLHVRSVVGGLPRDVFIRSEYAQFLEDLHVPEEALPVWRGALEVDPRLEPAHYHITRLLIDKNALDDALNAAQAGIEAAPDSARLYVAKAEVLQKQDHFYDARRTVREIAPKLPDPSLLEQLAVMEDAGGEHAAQYYREVVEGREKAGLATRGQTATLQRGLESALRDGDLDNAGWFQARLGTGPRISAASQSSVPGASVPGGLAALSFIAQSRPSSPERFLVEYARTVAQFLGAADKKVVESYVNGIHDHFRRIAELEAVGTRGGDHVKVTISMQDNNGRKNAEKALEILGWKMRSSGRSVKLEPAEKGSRTRGQDTGSALAIDEVAMQQNLEAGKPFSFDIPADKVEVVLGEQPWRAQFYPKERYAGGIAEAIAGDLQFAQTYAALGQMDPATAALLASGLGLKTLAEKYAPLLLQFSSAMAVEGGRAAVPGGEAADAIWTSLAGVSPRQPAAFFRALLSKDDGRLLAYYAALSALDIQHQRMFTRTAARTSKFYELFKEAPELQKANARHIPSGPFVEFLSEVPLDADGDVEFPGSPEVWMVVKGQSNSTSKMMKKLRRIAAPEVEDEILLRLARTRYKQSFTRRSELYNFLAVVRIDQHRSHPLDEASALLLAQHYAEDEAIYPLFWALTGLEQKQFEQFFALADTLRPLPEKARAEQLAAISPLIEIVCLAQESGALDEKQSAALFGRIVEAFQHVSSPAARTVASLDLLHEVLALGAKDLQANPDQAVQSLVLSAVGEERAKRFQQVLQLQKVPALATVLALSDAARSLGTGKGSAQSEIQTLESGEAGLFAVEVPKDLGLKGMQRELVEGFQPRRLQQLVKDFKDKTARKRVNLKDLAGLSQDYLAEIDAPVRWSLEGIVYAYFLSPDDLLVSEDPLLLRKHQFIRIVEGKIGAQSLFEHAELETTSEKAGSYFSGGFQDFADAAGTAAALSAKLGGGNGAIMASKQISAIRSASWERLRDQDLRLFGLKVAVAREWIVRSATRPELEASLATAALGLLSLTRRAELRGALADGDWRSVWNVLTLSDLYFLGDRYLHTYSTAPWQSPATQALQVAARGDAKHLDDLGPTFDDTFGYSYPQLRSTLPYEQYENDLMPGRLAERAAEFKLYLAQAADHAGIPASRLGGLAEPAARAILKRLQLADLHDWRSVLSAYATLDVKLIQEVQSHP